MNSSAKLQSRPVNFSRSFSTSGQHSVRSAGTALVALLVLLTGCGERNSARVAERPTAWFAGGDLPTYLDCARENQVTLIQAHRAGPGPGLAENSLGAISASLAAGALFLEIDVGKTADGTLVLLHDDTLERTTTGSGTLQSVSDRDLQSLRLLDPRGRVLDEGIPTLAEALEHLDGRGVAQIDIKIGVSSRQLAQELRRADALDRVIIISYSVAAAIAFHRQEPRALISVGIDGPAELKELEDAGINLDQLSIWLGLGSGRPALDRQLADLGVETSYGDFAAERRGTASYRQMARNGAEIISVDDVDAATRALDANTESRNLLEACTQARGGA